MDNEELYDDTFECSEEPDVKCMLNGKLGHKEIESFKIKDNNGSGLDISFDSRDRKGLKLDIVDDTLILSDAIGQLLVINHVNYR